MAWPPRVRDRSEIAEEDLEYYDAVADRAKRGAGKHYMQLMGSPKMTYLYAQIGRTARLAGDRGDSFTHAAREWIDQVLGVDLKTNMLWGLHLADGVAAGVRIEGIEALRAGREDDLTDEERMLTAFIRGVLGGTLKPDQWNAMEERFGERGVVEYAYLVVYIYSQIRIRQAMEDVVRPTDAAVDAMIEEVKSGSTEPADFRSRIA